MATKFGLRMPSVLAISVWLRRKLRGRELERRDAAQKIVENPKLRALQRIAQQFRQFAELQRGCIGRLGVLAGQPGRLGISDRSSLRHSHLSDARHQGGGDLDGPALRL
jgi:hypothetical protein